MPRREPDDQPRAQRAAPQPPSRLSRQLGTFDAVMIGLGSMIGAGVPFRNDIVRGPGGAQVLIEDPSGNLVELFQPATR